MSGMPDNHEPVTSVIIANYNKRELLSQCMAFLSNQSFKPFEIIIVENGSTDGSVELIRDQFPRVNLITLSQNVGFSRANNLGIQHARGRYIALLNNDTEPDPNWLAELVSALDNNPQVGFCASKILHWDRRDIADACGDFYTIEGMAGKIGHLEKADLFDEPRQVFGASAGAAIYRRSMLEEIGPLDDDFFLAHEDTDLSFRAQIMGYKCLYVPSAVVYHHVSATIGAESDNYLYYGHRNNEFVYMKNMPTPLLVKYLPLHLLTVFLLFLLYLRSGRARPFVKAKLDALRMLPGMLKKRRKIQRARRVSADEIDRLLVKSWLVRATRRKLRNMLSGGEG